MRVGQSEGAGRSKPPASAASSTDRDLRITPPLQLKLHALQAPHALILQSPGHMMFSLQLPVLMSWGHTVPPSAGERSITRFRETMPAPQVRVHVDLGWLGSIIQVEVRIQVRKAT
jgi:hypothetical protein